MFTIVTVRGDWLTGNSLHDIIHYIRLGILGVFAIEWFMVFMVYWHQLFTHVHLLMDLSVVIACILLEFLLDPKYVHSFPCTTVVSN
jgi:hypothetical protein